MLKRFALALLTAALLTLSLGTFHPTPAFAAKSAKALIKKGQKLFDEQLYEESIQVLSAGLMRPEATKAQKIKLYQLLAYNYIVLQKNDEADGAVRGLLVLEEEFALPDTESPRFRQFFDKVKAQWVKDGKPGLVKGTPAAKRVNIKHASPAQVDPDLAVSLDGTIDDPDATVSKVNLYYRQGASGKWTKVPVKYAMRKFTVDIPASAVAPPLVEYYFEARDDKGLPVAVRGDIEAPLRIAVKGEEASVVTSPWLWVPVSAAVVAAVITVVAVATTSTDATVTVAVFE